MSYENGRNIFGGEDGMDLPSPSRLWEGLNPEASLRLQNELAALTEDMEAYPWNDTATPITALVLSDKPASGRAYPEMGIVAIGEKFVTFPDQSIPAFLLAHERTHLHVASEVRGVIQEKHGDIYKFFHERIIPDWLSGAVEFEHDENYIEEKGWSGLYNRGDWRGRDDTELEPAIAAVDNYFTLLRKGLIRESKAPNGERFIRHNSPIGWEEEVISKPDKNIAAMYDENPQGFTRLLLTGFMLGSHLTLSYRRSLGGKSGLDLSIGEEGFANFVGSGLTGVSLDAVNHVAPQADARIYTGKRMAGMGPSAGQALSSVRSYEGLVQFVRR